MSYLEMSGTTPCKLIYWGIITVLLIIILMAMNSEQFKMLDRLDRQHSLAYFNPKPSTELIDILRNGRNKYESLEDPNSDPMASMFMSKIY